MVRIAVIGAGNVATSLVPAMYRSGLNVAQIFSRTYSKSEKLAKIVEAVAVRSISEINANIIIISVPDDAIAEVVLSLPPNDSIVVHTSGSTDMNIFEPRRNYGVLYPLQTFSKKIPVDMFAVPIFIEGNSEKVVSKISEIAAKISNNVSVLNSTKRMMLHISAVFSCNFFNSLLSCAFDLCHKNKINPQLLKPLVDETFAKAFASENPAKVQTGPAARGDIITIEKHIKLLENNPDYQEIYEILSKQILKKPVEHLENKLKIENESKEQF